MLESTKHALPDVVDPTTSGSQCHQSPLFRGPRDQKKWRALATRILISIFFLIVSSMRYYLAWRIPERQSRVTNWIPPDLVFGFAHP